MGVVFNPLTQNFDFTGSSSSGSGTVTSVTSADANATVATTTTTPVITIVSAPKLLTARTISITGDLAYTSPSFDGTGNVTAAGALATVNSNVGSFGSATQVPTYTVNAKGLTTAASNTTIQIAESQVTNLVSDLASKAIPTVASTTATPGATPSIATTAGTTTYVDFTGLNAAITSMTTNLTGTPVRGDRLWVSFTDNGTARAITWGASFEASTVVLPTTTVISTRLDVGFVWNIVTSKWRCVAAA